MDLLSLAVRAHGGLDRWERLSEIRVRLDAGGLALASKWKPRALRDLRAAVSTRTPRTVFEGFPRAGMRGIFEPEVVRLEEASGRVAAERRNPRSAFRGIRHALWWDDLDVLYFAGYALWNYLTAPFLLLRPGVETRELPAAGGRGRRLAVGFPPDLPTHSRTQVFHFDGSGLLRRLDYTAEVFGGWARAAHHCDGYREVDGITVATRRRVVPRGPAGSPLPGPTLVWIRLDDVRLT